MAVSTIGVADAGTPDRYLHTHSRVISSTAREDQYIQHGEGAYPTYTAVAASISVATANDHVLQVMGDGTNYSRIKRIEIIPRYATAAGLLTIGLFRLSTAGTGGSSVTPAPHDTADTYAGAAMTLPSSKGTESTLLREVHCFINDGTPTELGQSYTWEAHLGEKPIIFGTATSNGVAFKSVTAQAGGLLTINVEFITTSYL